MSAARECLGTRWHHQGRLPGVGLDCVGLIVHAVRAAGYELEDSTDYGRVHDGGRLLRELDSRLERVAVADAQPGDVVAFTWTERAAESQHVGILSGTAPLSIIHSHAGQRRVVEHAAGEYWSSRIAAVYRIPGGTP